MTNTTKKSNPLFSVIIPCYNSSQYIGRLLDCIYNQTYNNIQLILINDGSTDNTLDILKKSSTKLKKKNITVDIKTQENKGLGGAINTGLKLVKGDYFCWLDSDDLIANEYLEDFAKEFIKDDNCNVIKCNGYLVPENEIDLIGKKEFRMISDWNTNPFDKNLFMNMLVEVNYNFPCSAIRTKAFDKVVKNRDIYESRAGQNFQLLLPMFYNYKSSYVNKPNYFWTERSNSLSRDYKNQKFGELYNMYDEHERIILETLKRMEIKDFDYYEKLLKQKYIIKKLEYAKLYAVKKDIEKYERKYGEEVMKDNVYEKEVNKVRNKKPLVSIVIPVYNGSNYMREAIDSALAQDYPNIEVLVINDGSKDDGKTAEIAKSYGDKIRYFEKENGGVSTALNLGIKEMKGEYFSWLSHDDRYYENKISTQMNYLIDNNLLNKNVITYTDYDIINEKSKVIGETEFKIYRPNDKPELAMLRGLISGTALLIPKKALEEYGGFDTKYRCIQDYLLFFEFMKTYKYIYIPKTTNSTRVHAGQVTHVNPKVIEENNFLWIKMQEDITDDVKIRLMHSVYDFYVRMERYLKGNVGDSKNDYVEAREHALKKAEEVKESATKKFAKIFDKEKEDKVYSCLYKYYTDCNKFKKVKDKIVSPADEKLLEKIKLIINEMGLHNTIEYAYENTTNENKKKNYSIMLNCLKCYYPYYFKTNNKLEKLFAYYKGYGFIKTSKKLIIKFCNKFKLWKFIRIFIPEKNK